MGAYLLRFESSPGFTVLGIELMAVAGCDQLSSGPDASGSFSIDGQCALAALETGTLVAELTVRGTPDSLLQLDTTSNFTDFDTFLDFGIDPVEPTGFPALPRGTIALVVPEPSTLGLLGAGLTMLGAQRRSGRSPLTRE